MSDGLTIIVWFLGGLAVLGFAVCGWVLYGEHQYKKKAGNREAAKILESNV